MIGLFLGLIGSMMAAGWIAPKRSFSETENRYLAGKPEVSLKSIVEGRFQKGYESYLSDQFPLRNALVALKVRAEQSLMRKDINGVYFGRDGYYIERFDTEDLMTEQLSKNLSFLSQASQQMADQLGEDHFRIMLVPSAAELLTDKLPAFAAPANQTSIVQMMKEQLSVPERLVEVGEVLQAHKEQPIFYRTDHHWTTLGAYYGYKSYMESIKEHPWEEQAFKKEIVSSNFLGTIQSKVNILVRPDQIICYQPEKEINYEVFYDGNPNGTTELYNKNALEKKDQYKFFLDGNHGWTKIINKDLRADKEEHKGRKLLIIRDSFANCFAPFIANHFNEVHLVDLRYYNQRVSDLIKQEEISDVLILYQIPGFAKDQNLFKIIR